MQRAMTRIVCTADIHEHLPEIPECNLLLIAGDVSFALKGDLASEHAFLEGPFAKAYLRRNNAKALERLRQLLADRVAAAA